MACAMHSTASAKPADLAASRGKGEAAYMDHSSTHDSVAAATEGVPRPERRDSYFILEPDLRAGSREHLLLNGCGPWGRNTSKSGHPNET
jgi:hypothetical protein